MRLPLALLCCLLALASGTTHAVAAVAGSAGRGAAERVSARGLLAAALARRLLGVPYRSGGASPEQGFDCSGLVRYVYAQLGLELPHASQAQFRLGRTVARGGLAAGDLVFFDGAGHVGIYLGDGRFVHAPHAGARVAVASLGDSWYRLRYDGARRLV